MASTSARLAGLLLLAIACQLGLASLAGASTPTTPAPVAAPISADPVGVARGTMIMVHGGGWAGHDAHAQRVLMDRPGVQLLEAGWRVVSLDYEEGTAGLQNLLDAVGAELARGTGHGPTCVYGESAGAHLALVAASRLRAIDCVIGLGAPIVITLYEDTTDGDPMREMVAHQMYRFFGSTPAETAPWDLVALAPSIHADVLLLHEGDDTVVPAIQAERFDAARPSTRLVELEPGDAADPSTHFVHSTASAAGRARYTAEIDAFAARAVSARHAERLAARTGCAGVNRSLAEVHAQRLRTALLCLAAKDGGARSAGVRSWTRTTLQLSGEVNAARIWAALRATSGGRRALAAAAQHRARLSLRATDATRVVLSRRRPAA